MGAAVADNPALRRSARQIFTSQKVPPGLAWINDLSRLHYNLFVVDLHTALSSALIHKDNGDALIQVVEEWQATAEIDADPELAKKLKTPRSKKTYREWKP